MNLVRNSLGGGRQGCASRGIRGGSAIASRFLKILIVGGESRRCPLLIKEEGTIGEKHLSRFSRNADRLRSDHYSRAMLILFYGCDCSPLSDHCCILPTASVTHGGSSNNSRRYAHNRTRCDLPQSGAIPILRPRRQRTSASCQRPPLQS